MLLHTYWWEYYIACLEYSIILRGFICIHDFADSYFYLSILTGRDSPILSLYVVCMCFLQWAVFGELCMYSSFYPRHCTRKTSVATNLYTASCNHIWRCCVCVCACACAGGGGAFGEWSESLPTSPIQLTPLPLDSKRHVEQFKGHILWLACDYSPKSALCILSSTYCVLLIDGSHAYIHTYIRVVYILMHVIGDQDKCSASWEYPV